MSFLDLFLKLLAVTAFCYLANMRHQMERIADAMEKKK